MEEPEAGGEDGQAGESYGIGQPMERSGSVYSRVTIEDVELLCRRSGGLYHKIASNALRYSGLLTGCRGVCREERPKIHCA